MLGKHIYFKSKVKSFFILLLFHKNKQNKTAIIDIFYVIYVILTFNKIGNWNTA